MNAKRFMAILFCLLAGPLCARAADEITREKIESGKQTRTYFIYVPSTLKQDTKVPLLILLHGSGRNGRSLVEKWTDLAKAEGFIIVGPDSYNPASWRMPQDGPEFLFDLTEMLLQKYPIAQDRIYVFGHSGGAVMALALAMFESEYYAAVAVHAGAWRSDAEFKAIDSATRKIPLMLIVGDSDNFFPLNDVKKTQAKLVERGFDVPLLILKNHTHNYYGKAQEINRDAWQFLRQNALSGERLHVRVSFNSTARTSQWSPDRTNSLKRSANDLIDKFYGKEEELRKKDLLKQRSEVASIARAELLLSDEDPSPLIAKRNELAQKSHAVNQSAEDLEKRANLLRPK